MYLNKSQGNSARVISQEGSYPTSARWITSAQPFSRHRHSADLFDDEIHSAAMHAAQAKLRLCRARSKGPGTRTRVRGVLDLLVSGEQRFVESLVRIRNGGLR